ncbi:MAG: hypothetical protein Rubg2KO_26550 [Rubricoccaceae bacterium]
MLRTLLIGFALALAGPLAAQPYLPDPPGETCTPRSIGNPAALLDRAVTAAGIDGSGVVHAQLADIVAQPFQSDRPYPPFFSVVLNRELWYDLDTGTERVEGTTTYVGQGPFPNPTMLRGSTTLQMERGEQRVQVPTRFGPSRELNAWAVLHDWRAGESVQMVAECLYRDFPRIVLERTTENGPERLYLDPESGLPVKLDREEEHILWGQTRVEYLYSTWIAAGDGMMPGASFRIVDGLVETSRTVADVEQVITEDVPDLALSDDATVIPSQPDFMPDTVRVAEDVYLLVTRAYTEAVALVNDTVYVFDATTEEARALADMERIAQLFPGDHPVVVVVTDLAWPHVAGVRAWVSKGATVLSHTTSEPFLRRVVEHRWTRQPDRLEQRRSSATFRFVGVDEAVELGNGRIRVAPIGGIGSEGALMAYLPDVDFLWASDYIQTLQTPSTYAAEVIQAAERLGWTPETVSAQHLPLVPWSDVVQANS